MNEKLTAALHKKYPKILPTQRPFEHGDGWYNIIDGLCATIQSHIDETIRSNAEATNYNAMLDAAVKGKWGKFNRYHKAWSPTDPWILSRKKEIIDYYEVNKNVAHRAVPDICKQVEAIQVKEKFGGLRFYFGGGDTYIDGLVAMAEAMSSRTCEECGSPGKSRTGGWIRTLCNTHAKNHPNDV